MTHITSQPTPVLRASAVAYRFAELPSRHFQTKAQALAFKHEHNARMQQSESGEPTADGE